MSDYYWPQKAPTALHVDYITQVKYSIHGTHKNHFEVKETNLYDGVTQHRTYLPAFYRVFFKQFLWKLYLTIRLYHTFQNSKETKFKGTFTRLLKIMVHLDNVVEAIIRPSLDIRLKDIARWRNPNFNEYLITEFLIGRHDPVALEQFRCSSDTNIERIKLSDLNWEDYKDKRINAVLEGRTFNYNAEAVPEKSLETMWDLLIEHYDRPFDAAWLKRWVMWEGDSTDQEEGDTHVPAASKGVAANKLVTRRVR